MPPRNRPQGRAARRLSVETPSLCRRCAPANGRCWRLPPRVGRCLPFPQTHHQAAAPAASPSSTGTTAAAATACRFSAARFRASVFTHVTLGPERALLRMLENYGIVHAVSLSGPPPGPSTLDDFWPTAGRLPPLPVFVNLPAGLWLASRAAASRWRRS